MVQICTLRASCYVLALVSVVLTWYFLSPGAVNHMLDAGEVVAKTLAWGVADMLGVKRGVAETIAIEKMHADRTLVLSALMLLWLTLIVLVIHGEQYVAEHVSSVFLALFVVHVGLAVAWIGWTEETGAFYTWHAGVLKEWLRHFGYHHAETLVLRFFHLHSLLVLGEAIIVYTAIAYLISKART